jgi:glycosyltransferase involved in cell wall biosynthesis
MKCGVGDYTERLAKSLQDYADIDVSVLTSTSDVPIPPSAGPAVNPVMSTWGRSGLRDFFCAMHRIQPDILHIQFPTQGYASPISALSWIPWISRVFQRIPVVLTWHEYVPSSEPVILRCMQSMAIGASALVVVRPDYPQKMSKLMRVLLGRAPIRFIPNVSNVPSVVLSPEERHAMRERLGCGNSKVIAYFGFTYPHKGTHLLFQIANPQGHHLLLIGNLSARDPYHAELLRLAAAPQWKGKVTVAGFVETEEAARLLAVADAVVFPFMGGGGTWNTSLHAAACQGTFVLVTSTEKNGYDPAANIYYAVPQSIAEMQKALNEYAGIRNPHRIDAEESWRNLAAEHEMLYRSLAR